jgi:hypothetical protein
MCCRVGEASNPGPPTSFDDPDAVGEMDFDDYDCQPCSRYGQDAWAPWDCPPPDVAETVESLQASMDDTVSPLAARSGGAIGGGPQHCQLELDPLIGFLAHGSTNRSVSQFAGAAAGWVFKMGPLGLGYYLDQPDIVVNASLSDSKGHADDLVLSYILQTCPRGLEGRSMLSLDQLVPQVIPPPKAGNRPLRTTKRLPRKRKSRLTKAKEWSPPSVLGASKLDSSHLDAGVWAIDTYNGNVMTTAHSYIASSAADIVCIQEPRLAACDVPAAERAAGRIKWGLSLQPAAITDANSTSAGAGIATRSHIGMSTIPNLPWFANLDSRLHVRHVAGVCKGGIYILSAYFWCTIGLTGRNVALLESIAFVVRRLRGPWVLAADWNFGPEALRQNGWLRLVGGKVRCSGVATCKGNEFDFFVVADSINHAVLGVARITDTGAGPHSAVRMWVKGHLRKDLVRVVATPPKAEAMQPLGCHNLQATQQWEAIAPDTDHQSMSQAVLDGGFSTWIRRAEETLCDIGSISGKDRIRFISRSDGAALVWRPAAGPIATNGLRISMISVAWKTVSAWFTELAAGASTSAPASMSAKAARARWLLLSTSWEHLGESMHAKAIRGWLKQLSFEGLSDRANINWLRATSALIAQKTHDYDCRKSEAAWSKWLHSGPGGSIGRHHRLTKVNGGWVPSPSHPTPDEPEAYEHLEDDEELTENELAFAPIQPMSPQDEADSEAVRWGKEWNANGAPPVIPWPKECWSNEVPALTVETMRSAALSFSSGTGLGWDKLHPRAMLRLPAEAIEALVRLCIMAEVLSTWTAGIGLVLICLIPKADGGRRPIGLLPSIIRWWMRARLVIVRAWQAAHERVYFYAGAGKCAKVASWKQAARAELARAIPQVDYAGALLDMVKAFERVPLEWLVRQGKKYAYPMQILALSIKAYQLPRTVVIDGICSALVLALRGITAGAGHATVELRLLIIQWVDETLTLFMVTISVYVDDASIEAAGSSKFVRHHVAGATKYFTEAMREVGMEWSPSKNAVLAAKKETATAIIDKLPNLKIQFVERAKSLGGALGAGTKRNVQVQRSRLAAFRTRKTQFQKFRRMAGAKAVSRVLRTGGIAAMVYGQAITGVSNSMLQQQRVATAAAASRGGSGELDFALVYIDGSIKGRADPAFAAHNDPISSWAEAVWSSWMPRPALGKMLQAATEKQEGRASPWAIVFGPAAAFLATARRLSWQVRSELAASSDLGVAVDFTRDSPAFVARMVAESVARWRWRRIEARHPSLVQGTGGHGAHMQPIFQLLNSRKVLEDWGPKTRGAFVSAATNRQWPQARLYQAHLVETRNCRLCVAMGLCDPEDDDPKHKGTMVHRLWICPALHPYRLQCVDAALIREARSKIARDGSMAPADFLLYTRAVMPSLEPMVPKQNPQESFEWVVGPGQHLDTTGYSVYIDGSFLYSEARYCGLASRRGWALAVYNAADELVASARGRPPHWVQGIHGAELWSLLQAVQLGILECKIFTDCMAVLLGARRGETWANESRRTYSRLWGPVSAALEGNTESLLWLPAHCTGSQVAYKKISDGSPMKQRHRIGNAEVDTQAKGAASNDRLPIGTLQWIAAKGNKVTDIAMWIGRCTYMANHFRDPRGDPEARPVFLRDSEGLATTRLQKYKAGRKRKVPAVPSQPGDLSQCPRWQRIRQRILDRAQPQSA